MSDLSPILDFDALMAERDSPGMALFYLSRPSCGVCSAIKPKIRKLLESYPEIRAFDVNLDDIPEAAGQLSVLTIPAVLGYSDGKEFLREARYMSMDDIALKIDRPYGFLFGT